MGLLNTSRKRYQWLSCACVCGAVLVSGCGTEEPTPLGGDDASISTPDAALRDSASGDATEADAGAGGSAPHIVIVIADDFGIDVFGPYGDVDGDGLPDDGRRYPRTENLTALCQAGMRFESTWSAPTCSPTRAAILTGRYGFRTGIGAALPRGEGISVGEPTLPRILGTSGYATANIGKWHLGTTDELDGQRAPLTMGWSYYAGSTGGALMAYDSWTRVENGESSLSEDYATTVNIDDAITWAERAGNDSPWLLWVALNAPHAPFHRPPDGLHSVNLDGLDPEARPRPHYRAMVEALDAEVGRLLASLEMISERDLYVVFLGDNGTPGNIVQPPFDSTRAKDTVFQGGVHVPFCVRGPGVEAGSRSEALVHVTDLFATALDLAGVVPRIDEDLRGLPSDGVSFLPVLLGESDSERRVVYTEGFGSPRDGRDGYALRDSRYKLIVLTDGVEYLFDLKEDPREEQNLLEEPELSIDEADAYAALQASYLELRTP